RAPSLQNASAVVVSSQWRISPNASRASGPRKRRPCNPPVWRWEAKRPSRRLRAARADVRDVVARGFGGCMISRMNAYKTIEEIIGSTPLVRLQRLPGDAGAARGNVILAKLRSEERRVGVASGRGKEEGA